MRQAGVDMNVRPVVMLMMLMRVDAQQIDRGFFEIEKKLASVGAQIDRLPED